MTDYTQYVNTNIGTVGHLLQATRPAVLSPHGLAVLSPVFRPGMTDVYNSDKIFGFNAGSAVIMPVKNDQLPECEKIASVFDHDFEMAKPDLYSVYLEDADVYEKHTAFENVGIYEFSFSRERTENFISLCAENYSDYKIENGMIYLSSVVNKNKGAKLFTLIDIGNYCDICDYSFDNKLRLLIKYNSKIVTVPFYISYVGFQCLEECREENLLNSFEDIHNKCKNAWNELFSKIKVFGGTDDMKTVFYTALYRVCSRMTNCSTGGKYFGYDGKIHDDDGHCFYTNDGIWDTFRGSHPLQLLIEPEIHKDILTSYLRTYEQSGWMARFPGVAENFPCMIGHHTVSLFAEALNKGVEFDISEAYEAAYKNATLRTMLPWTDGEADELTAFYYRNGYFPALEEDEEETCKRVHSFENRQSVAVTIEHSYDDHCVSLLADASGDKTAAGKFRERSFNYKKLYNKDTGFFHPRKEDGSFTSSFDPKFCGGWGGRKYFAENNAYIYSFAAQHDIDGLIELLGGKEAFDKRLDDLYTETYNGMMKCEFLAQYPDATGLMGQFCMGNEPSFHIPYLYNYCGKAYKTQRKIHELISLWFTNSPLGICGDEDGGAMSAFLAFSAMGFYPVDPSSSKYNIGSPVFDRIDLTLPGGKLLSIIADGASGKKKYISSAVLNGEKLKAPLFTHSQIRDGGTLELIMSERPVKDCFE